MSRTRIKRKKSKPERREFNLEALAGILERAKAALSADDYEGLKTAVEILALLAQELEAKGTTIDRLRRMLFGASTEKTSTVLGDVPASDRGAGGEAADQSGQAAAAGTPGGDGTKTTGATGTDGSPPKRPGHGRNGAAAYIGAQKVKVPHATLCRGEACPLCQKGKLYPLAEPSVLVRITGMAPLLAKLYELGQLRCNLCGEVFTAEAPEGVGPDKYDESAAGMIGLLKYGVGLPFNRIARLEQGLGIPLPPPTQWEVVERAAGRMAPAHEELIRQAAQGQVLHNDDTKMKVLELTADSRREALVDEDEPPGDRTGVFTSGIVARADGHDIALFFTGRQHAGENLADVLRRRAAELDAPIQMCDALSANTAGELRTIVANCLAHARRQVVEVVDNFPDECRHILEVLRDVYRNDALARHQGMSPEERLRFHQAESGPLMADLRKWMADQFDERKVEPNSGLGEAISYMVKHWSKLTLFLEKPGAPLDNNICERALKKAILHRKNSYFYKTLNGARVGDIHMSVIHTAELNHVQPFDYLVALQRYHDHVAEHPADWMPWNYQKTLACLTKGPDPPR